MANGILSELTGYNILGNEITALNTDWREQLDISTPHPVPANAPAPTPLYANLRAPNQWPSPALLPRFRETYEAYIQAMSSLSTSFTALIAESLDLPSTAFDRFFDTNQQHKLKIVKYPDASTLPPAGNDGKQAGGTPTTAAGGPRQGVGPHKDSMLTSYLLQVPPHRGLQAQNLHGDWIDCPPVPGTLVVAIGQGLEALTHGVCTSTTHRVLSPAPGLGPRFSIPFFQGVSYDATFEHVDVPPSVRALHDARTQARGQQRTDDVEFTFRKGRWTHLGEATLMNRIKSHPDVGEAWYPDLLKGTREEQKRESEAKAKMTREEEKQRGEAVSGGILEEGVREGVAVQ